MAKGYFQPKAPNLSELGAEPAFELKEQVLLSESMPFRAKGHSSLS